MPHDPLPHSVADIRPGSAIVGSNAGDRLLIDFEGNLYGASNIVTFADRVLHAAERQAVKYPTVARRLVDPGDLVEVASFDKESGVVVVEDRELSLEKASAVLAKWLGSETLDPAELVVSSLRHV